MLYFSEPESWHSQKLDSLIILFLGVEYDHVYKQTKHEVVKVNVIHSVFR